MLEPDSEKSAEFVTERGISKAPVDPHLQPDGRHCQMLLDKLPKQARCGPPVFRGGASSRDEVRDRFLERLLKIPSLVEGALYGVARVRD
jgi:hypothetical protein